MIGAGWKPSDIWDTDTGETFGEALERFKEFGRLINADEALKLPLTTEVWSFGYGDDPLEFEGITVGELFDNYWQGTPLEDLDGQWGPFAVVE